MPGGIRSGHPSGDHSNRLEHAGHFHAVGFLLGRLWVGTSGGTSCVKFLTAPGGVPALWISLHCYPIARPIPVVARDQSQPPCKLFHKSWLLQFGAYKIFCSTEISRGPERSAHEDSYAEPYLPKMSASPGGPLLVAPPMIVLPFTAADTPRLSFAAPSEAVNSAVNLEVVFQPVAGSS
jgi:hypothetical protein